MGKNIKETQHEWYLRKKAGLPTYSRRKFANKKEKIDARNERQKKYNEYKKQLIRDIFGLKCFFCGHEKVSIIHNKAGIKHKKISQMNIKEIKHLNKEEYVRVCGLCHAGIHWSMKYMNLKWEEIIKAVVR